MYIWALSGSSSNPLTPHPRWAPGQKYRKCLKFASQMRAQNRKFFKLASRMRALVYLGTLGSDSKPQNPPLEAPLVKSFWNWLLKLGHKYIWALSDRGLNPQNSPPRIALGRNYRNFMKFATQLRAQNRKFLKLTSRIRAHVHLGTFGQGFEPPEPTPLESPWVETIGTLWNSLLRWGYKIGSF